MQRLRKEGSVDAEMVARSREDEVKMLGVGVAKRMEKVRCTQSLKISSKQMILR